MGAVHFALMLFEKLHYFLAGTLIFSVLRDYFLFFFKTVIMQGWSVVFTKLRAFNLTQYEQVGDQFLSASL
jgi:hypothetical protein